MKRSILAGLLCTACVQAFAQTPLPALAGATEYVALPLTPLAVSACPSIPDAPSRTHAQQSPAIFQAQLQKILDRLDLVSEQCLDSSRFHAQRGIVLQLMGQPAAAVESLERALLLDPSQAGTQLDYALALRDAGDTLSAQSLLSQISQRQDLPAGLQPLIQGELAFLQNQLGGKWEHQLKASLVAGVDNNLNNATSDSQLTLTFPAGDVSLQLADASRAQRGSTLMTTLQYQAAHRTNDRVWVLQAELRNRNTRSADTGYQQLDLGAQWLQGPKTASEAASQWQARLGYTNLRFGGVELLHSLRAAWVHQWQMAWPGAQSVCRPLAGLEGEARRYPANRLLDGAYRGLLLSLTCDTAQTSMSTPARGESGNTLLGHLDAGSPRFSLQLRHGQDGAVNTTRPGGNNTATDLRGAIYGRLQLPNVPTLDWVAEYSQTQQQDSSGYSPLLGNNAVRKSNRQVARLELARQLPANVLGGARLFVSAELSQQASNLNAFAAKGRSLNGGLRWNIF